MITTILKWRLTPKPRQWPLHLILFVTGRCNGQCRTCFYWQKLNRQPDLSFGQISELSQQLKKLIWLDVSGGEPFLRDDLPEICRLFYLNNKVEFISLPTNALKPDRVLRLAEACARLCPRAVVNIGVSLDGLEKTHDTVRGVAGNFARVIETIQRLVSLRASMANLTVTPLTTVFAGNTEEIVPLLKFTDSLDVDHHSINVIRGNPRDSEMAEPALAHIVDIFQQYRIYYRQNYRKRFSRVGWHLAIRLRDAILSYYLAVMANQRNAKYKCFAGNVSAVVESDGEVKLCELLEGVGTIGQDGTFTRIWRGQKAEDLRQKINAGCWCTHDCFHSKNVACGAWGLSPLLGSGLRVPAEALRLKPSK